MVGADWVNVYRDLDPAAAWRGRYDTEEGCMDMLREAGGIVKIVTRGLLSIGVQQRTRKPRAGDFALVRLGEALVAGAVCVSSKDFAVMTKDVGLVVSSAPVLYRAWKIV